MMNNTFRDRKVAIYARVSTEHDAQLAALENQVDWYKPILEQNPNWELKGMYVDEGITGTSARKRPQFLKMIEDAKQKKFDLIITREVSRFARNTVDTLQYTRELKSHGVEVYFINDGIKTFDGDGELRLTIMATLAQDESRKTSVRVKAGQQTSMRNGVYYGNGNILGYDRIDKNNFVINPEQASTVRRIFDLYLDGCGLDKIKLILESEGRLTSQGKTKWFGTVISHVLKNTFYFGMNTYHKEYVPDYLEQKKIRNFGEIEYLQTAGTHEPIVTEEEFIRVQNIMERRKTKMDYVETGRRAIGKRDPSDVWVKLLFCSCGHKFNRKVWHKTEDGERQYGYQCYGQIATGTIQTRINKGLSTDGICDSQLVGRWKLQLMANYIFRNYIEQKDVVLALANKMLESHIGDTAPIIDNADEIRQLQSEVDKCKKMLDGYYDMRSQGIVPTEVFVRKVSELNDKIEVYQKKIISLAPEEIVHPEIDYKAKMEVLRYTLEQYTYFREDCDIPENVIEAFIERIEVSKDGFKWVIRNGFGMEPQLYNVEGTRRQSARIVGPLAGTYENVVYSPNDRSGAGSTPLRFARRREHSVFSASAVKLGQQHR